ncbi:MAG: hypothetical protein QNL17_09010 [Synechococcus sp. ChSW.bin.154]|jgi:hypothetical protein
MNPWSPDVEEEVALVLKDWLKQQGRTQADLRRSLRATSTRMPALMEVLEREHRLGGLPRLAAKLCSIETDWINNAPAHASASAGDLTTHTDPFGQLDLLLREIRDDRGN